MDQRMTQGEQNLLLLESLIPGGERFYVWCYRKDGSFLASSCPQEEQNVLDQAFRVLGGMDKTILAAEDAGQSINSYIRFAKVERAKVLLTSTDTPVKEIAESLAFNTVNYFIQSFRETTGYSPAQYRKKFR